MSVENKIKIVILDEADGLSNSAQGMFISLSIITPPLILTNFYRTLYL